MVLDPERVLFEWTVGLELIMVVIRIGIVLMGQRLAVLMIGQLMAQWRMRLSAVGFVLIRHLRPWSARNLRRQCSDPLGSIAFCAYRDKQKTDAALLAFHAFASSIP